MIKNTLFCFYLVFFFQAYNKVLEEQQE